MKSYSTCLWGDIPTEDVGDRRFSRGIMEVSQATQESGGKSERHRKLNCKVPEANLFEEGDSHWGGVGGHWECPLRNQRLSQDSHAKQHR